MKTRLKMMQEIREASLESLIMMEVEMTHGMRMIEAMKGQADSAKLCYDITKEVNHKASESSQRRVAISILDKMIEEEEKNPKPLTEITNPPVREEEPSEPTAKKKK